MPAGSEELAEALKPHIKALVEAAQGVGENPAGFALVLPLVEEDEQLAMYVLGGLFGEEVDRSPESTFRVLAEALSFMLAGHLDVLGPLLPEVFERLVTATGGTVSTVHVDGGEVGEALLADDDAPPEPRWRRRLG